MTTRIEHDDALDELPAAMRNSIVALSHAVAKREAARKSVVRAVEHARQHGASWEWVAACLQISRQAAWEAYHEPTDLERLGMDAADRASHSPMKPMAEGTQIHPATLKLRSTVRYGSVGSGPPSQWART